jgi:hypothetical protein
MLFINEAMKFYAIAEVNLILIEVSVTVKKMAVPIEFRL